MTTTPNKFVTWVLALVCLVLVLAVCTAPDRARRSGAPGLQADLDTSAGVAELMARLDGELSDETGLRRQTVSALREMVLDRGLQITSLAPACLAFATTREAWGSEVLALLASLGDGREVAAALADAGGDVVAAEELVLGSRRTAGSWQTFVLRRKRYAELAGVDVSPGR